jgi:methionyl-tRNA formyltransferase
LRTVFFGTPEWAVPSLDALLASDVEVVAVVTNPDRPSGRGMKLQPSPVKAAATTAGVRVLQPARARDPELLDELRAIAPDVAVVVAYGSILPKSLLDVPPHGFVNVHFSLLPLYRGAAPVQRAIIDGRLETGVSMMVLTEGMDEGPVLAAEATPIGPAETAAELGERLATLGARALLPALTGYVSGALTPVPQDDSAATYAPKITTAEARIDWSEDARSIGNKVRALNPAPGAWTSLGDERVKLHRAAPGDHPELRPGELLVADRLFAGTGDGAIAIEEAQVAGRKAMSGLELARGLRLEPGAHFD